MNSNDMVAPGLPNSSGNFERLFLVVFVWVLGTSKHVQINGIGAGSEAFDAHQR